MMNTSRSAAPASTATHAETLGAEETLNTSIPLFTLWRGTPRTELIDTNNLQIIPYQSNCRTVQPPCFREARSNSPVNNAPSSSLPPSSSPPHIFSSSPLASSQSSIVEIGDDYKVEDRAMTMESDGQDSNSSPDVLQLDVAESAYNNQDDHADVDHQREKHKLADLATEEKILNTNEGAYDHEGLINLSLQKRPWSEEKIETLHLHAKDVTHLEDTRLAKRMKMDDTRAYLPPAPKRATFASQQQQFKKLIAPFRSPLILKTDEDAPSEGLVESKSLLPVILPPQAPKRTLSQTRQPQQVHAISSITPAKTRVRTLKAASQFKSPLSSSASASCGGGPSIRLTPTMQSLERKLQLLKRAVKVKENEEEMTLVGLVKKWTEAGREVAYELWDLVKESANNGDVIQGNGSWGWNEDTSKGRISSRDLNWGWDSTGTKREGHADEGMNTKAENLLDQAYTNKMESEDEEGRRNTMGTMLRQLGIAPETLGWDEDGEVFVD